MTLKMERNSYEKGRRVDFLWQMVLTDAPTTEAVTAPSPPLLLTFTTFACIKNVKKEKKYYCTESPFPFPNRNSKILHNKSFS